MKILLILLSILINFKLLATPWSPYKQASLNFALPHPYAAKAPIQSWYQNFFYDSMDDDEQELIQIIETNTSDPIYCTKITVGSITSKFCNPWVIAIFIKDGKYYLTHRRYKFFSTLNYMEVLKMNLDLDDFDEFHKVVLPFASKYTASQLSAEQYLVLSFYYMYDYQVNDNCFDRECQHIARTKRKHRLIKSDDIYNSYTWIHRTLLSGCSGGGSCITAREITYKVTADEPTTWRSSAKDNTFKDSWQGSLIWNQLQQSWVSGQKDLEHFTQGSSPVQIPDLPLPQCSSLKKN